ncbi:CCT_1a_G0006640.mRNA.1.CDS.1 [Saccharomyces cerevisiae]|nr:CCT_1a_G0006640.mRNA.1.CDS.1 [Saccharomyces cerevisiae]CAI7175789.1 CCT_1a_G0006640.mRNA.1.CDS.1 [Saccharomyces cerevisiae]
MNATENALLFKCGSKGYINQTYTPTEIYNCGVAEGKKTAKEKNPTYSIVYNTFLTWQPAESPETFTCGSHGFTNASYVASDFYACGFMQGKGTETNAGIHSTRPSHSLAKFIILFMLVVYTIV